MKSLPLKLGIGVVLLFAVVIAICLLWMPVRYAWLKSQLMSSDDVVCEKAIKTLVAEGKRAESFIIRELEHTQDKQYIVSLCTAMEEIGSLDKVPQEARIRYLIEMIWVLYSDELCAGFTSPEMESLVQESGDSAADAISRILEKAKPEDIEYVPGDSFFSRKGNFLFSLVTCMENLDRLDAVPVFLKTRYFVAELIPCGSEYDSVPLDDLGKPMVPEIIESAPKGMMSNRLLQILCGITFQGDDKYCPEDCDENKAALTKALGHWKTWWESHKNTTQIEWAIERLESELEGEREGAFEFIYRATLQDFGYDPCKDSASNADSIRRIKNWWKGTKATPLVEQLFQKLESNPKVMKLDRSKYTKNLQHLIFLMHTEEKSLRVLAAITMDAILHDEMPRRYDGRSYASGYIDYNHYSDARLKLSQAAIRDRMSWWLRHRKRFPNQVLPPGLSGKDLLKKFIDEIEKDEDLAKRHRKHIEKIQKEVWGKK